MPIRMSVYILVFFSIPFVDQFSAAYERNIILYLDSVKYLSKQ